MCRMSLLTCSFVFGAAIHIGESRYLFSVEEVAINQLIVDSLSFAESIGNHEGDCAMRGKI